MILVFCDSLAFYGPQGGLPANDPRIWPNVLGENLNTRVELVGKIGWTARDAWWALIQDPRIWAMLPEVKLVILAVGSMDSLPSPLPTVLRESIRYIRPEKLRRNIRNKYSFLQKKLAGVGWPQALPPNQTIYFLNKIVSSIQKIKPEVEFIASLPAMHASEAYNYKHPARNKVRAKILTWTRHNQLKYIDFTEILRPYFVLGKYNPDGIHWSFEIHTAVAEEFIKIINNS